MQKYSAPKSFTLIGDEVIPFNYGNGDFSTDPPHESDDKWLAFPHLRNLGGVLYSTLNSDDSTQPAYLAWRSIVKEADAPWWPLDEPRTKVVMYIRE